MRVNTWKNIDVEVEVDVDIHDVINECSRMAEDASPDFYREWLGSIDVLTRILSRSKDEVIAAVPEEARREVHRRLMVELARWALPIPVDVSGS